MRTSFVQTLIELAEENPKILLLTADLGFSVVEPFSERFPNRFFNVGVAEQNMVGIATGLAECGFIPYLYSISTFMSMRCYEFIRNGPVLHRLPVRILGIGGGFEYGHGGMTHYALEDVGIMRLHPELLVICPADFEQAKTAARSTVDHPGPVYFRLGKDDQNAISPLRGQFALGNLNIINDGIHTLILSMGAISIEVNKSVNALRSAGLNPGFAVISHFNPDPTGDLAELLMRYPVIVTVEAHYLRGGLFSFVSETAARIGSGTRVVPFAVKEMPDGGIGSQAWMQDRHGISSEQIIRGLSETLKQSRPLSLNQ